MQFFSIFIHTPHHVQRTILGALDGEKYLKKRSGIRKKIRKIVLKKEEKQKRKLLTTKTKPNKKPHTIFKVKPKTKHNKTKKLKRHNGFGDL